jgi:hypothetical protein
MKKRKLRSAAWKWPPKKSTATHAAAWIRPPRSARLSYPRLSSGRLAFTSTYVDSEKWSSPSTGGNTRTHNMDIVMREILVSSQTFHQGAGTGLQLRLDATAYVSSLLGLLKLKHEHRSSMSRTELAMWQAHICFRAPCLRADERER